LASVLPIQPIEKQTILELDSSREKLDYLKGIIKKLGG
jgi:Lon protease-like protein